MMNDFSNNIKYKSPLGQIKHSNAFGHYLFKGITTGLALKYVAKGEETYFINNQTIVVPEDNFILVKPNTDFEADTKTNAKQTSGICIDIPIFSANINITKILENEVLYGQAFSFSCSSAIGQQLHSLGQSLHSKEKNSFKDNTISKIGLHLSMLSESILSYKKEIYPLAKKETTQILLIPKLLKAKEYLARNYKKNITLDQLAKEATISKFQFQRLFKKVFGNTPQEMQSNLRMTEAHRMIILSNKSTTTTASNSLMALMCFHASRFEARNAENGFIPYDEQDSSKWNLELINKGHIYLNEARQGNEINK